MAYALEYHAGTVVPYLRSLPLSREARVRLFTALSVNLGQHGDTYRNAGYRRLAESSPYFWYDFVLLDTQGENRLHQFRFVISDEAAVYGVLRIVYVEEEHGPAPPGLL